MSTVHAIFEDGIFRPIEAVALPDHCEVAFEPRVIEVDKVEDKARARLFKVLRRSYDSGQTDVAERHNEHQP